MAILNNSNAISSGGYDINNSLRFRSSASAYLSRTPATATNRKTWTWSGWVKRGALSSAQTLLNCSDGSGNNEVIIGIQANDTLIVYSYIGAYQLQLTTTQLFRDPSAWYHIVVAIDTTQATAANRVKIYVNGNQVTAFSTATYPSQNYDSYINIVQGHSIGRDAAVGRYLDGYLAEINFIDGSAKTPSDFGETDTTTGSWKPKAYTGTYGTNGFYLKFSDIATTSGSNAGLGKDFSGNANYFTTNNISVTAGSTYDAMIDSPTLTSATVANYAVMNPLYKDAGLGAATFSNANLKTTATSAGFAISTIGVTSGKWYWEFTADTVANSTENNVGVTAIPFGSGSNFRAYGANGQYFNGSSWASYGATYTNGDIIGVALDMDAQTLTFYKNNSSQGQKTSIGLTGLEIFSCCYENTTNASFSANFGQRPFSYTPPSGFVRLNTFNLSTPTILQGNKYMDATLWTGNGTSQSIVNAGAFKPDFVWVKSRSNTFNNNLFNSTSGINKFLVSDTTAAEASVSGTLTAFNSNGFSVGSDIGLNYSGGTYVGWQWQAGQGTTSSNTSGSITSTVSVNATAGFSVVTYTGTGANATVGHGLGVAPKMVIVKQRNTTRSWYVYHASLASAANYLVLDSTAAAGSDTTLWNNTAPTSSVFSLGANIGGNQSTGTYVAYCWAEIAGFSKFTSYTGNNSDDGPFVYCGFRPKFVMIKDTNTAGYWAIFDSNRATYNVVAPYLQAQSSAAEVTIYPNVDFLANGIKLRANNANSAQNNINGNTYIVIAFAENPLKNSLAR